MKVKRILKVKSIKCFSILVMLCFIMNNSITVMAAQPSTASSNNDFKTVIEAAVSKAFVGISDELSSKVIEALTPEIDKLNNSLSSTISSIKEKKDAIETGDFKMDLSEMPSETIIANIPEQGLAQARVMAQKKVSEGIGENFDSSVNEIQDQIKSLIVSSAPQIKEQLTPSLRVIISKVSSIVEKTIADRIDAEIVKVLPDAMILIPTDMEKLSPEEIAERMQAQIKPKVESTMRPIIEAQMRAEIKKLVTEKISKPIDDKMKPKILSMEVSSYDKYVDQLPSYLERVISKSSIKGIVHENIIKLQSKISALIESQKGELETEINDYIENLIENEAKIYLGDSAIESDVKARIMNNRLMIPFRAIATALGADVQWLYASKQVVMTKNGTEIKLTLDSDAILVNGKPAKIDVPAASVEGRTLVPVRFIAETFGMEVTWQPDWKMVNMVQK